MKAHVVPEHIRKILAMPIGELISLEKAVEIAVKSGLVVTVGDRVTETISEHRNSDVQIVDNRENRKQREPARAYYRKQIRTVNPAGTITDDAVRAIKNAFMGEKPVRIVVDGEEDLLALPALILAPENASIFYGQPSRGIVHVKSGKESKERWIKIMFEIGFEEKELIP